MAGQDSNARIAELLKQACPPAAASPEFKVKLRQRLNEQATALGTESPKPLWQQPFFWIPAAAASAMALALIIYLVAFHSVPLTVTSGDATGIQTTTATLNGNLDSLGAADSVEVSFQWGTSTDFGNETTPELHKATGSFAADLSDLAPNTKYYFRVKAVGRDGTAYGPPMDFTTGPVPPEVTTDDAAKIRTDSATLRGSLDNLGSAASVSVSFEWGLAESYGNETTLESETATGKYSADLSGLSPNTTYHFRAKAVGDDTAYGADVQFTTTATPPSAATNDATNISTNSAQLNGELSSLGTVGSVSVSFEWGLTKSYGNETIPESQTATGKYSAILSGLSPNTTYHFRAKVVGDDTTYGADAQFTTGATGPSVATNDATDISTKSAWLNGDLTSLGTATSVNVSFEYGTATGSYTHTTADQSRTSTGAFSANLSGLVPGVTCYYRAKACGDGDTVYGEERSFTTPTIPPSVTTSSATEVRSTSAALNGILNSLGTAGRVTVCFEWGTAAGYDNQTAPQTKDATGGFSANLTGLTPNTTYHFRVGATGHGIVYGDDITFTTGNAPPPQETWYLSGDGADVKMMYEGDTSKQEGTVPLHSNGQPVSQVWWASQSSSGTTYTADNWTVRLALSHISRDHLVMVEIGTWDGKSFDSHGSHTLTASGNNNQEVYVYDVSLQVSSFAVPPGSYVATRLTVNSRWVDVHVGGSQSRVTSPAYQAPTAPVATINTVTPTESTTAALNGSLDSLGIARSVMVYFDWGMTTDYGDQVEVGSKNSAGNFSAILPKPYCECDIPLQGRGSWRRHRLWRPYCLHNAPIAEHERPGPRTVSACCAPWATTPSHRAGKSLSPPTSPKDANCAM
jgi:phosphodiesterase/alkaline phosphatase D-like protein